MLFARAAALAVHGAYSLDEYQYAHGAWLIARGQVIFRDFFEHHFPLLHQLLALVWLGLDDDPAHLALLRLTTVPVILLTLWAGWQLNRRFAGAWAIVTLPAILALPTYVLMATQLRPDPLAAALFLAALALVARAHARRAAGASARAAAAG
ncbi:MAG: hypothetical protein AAF772_15710, partial [Acidobacteriota bacterium]